MNHGHCHPKVAKAMTEQLNTLTMTGRCMYNNKMHAYQQLLNSTMGFEMSLLMNSGSEACESAVKMARKWAHTRKGVAENQARVVFPYKNFWGRTIAATGNTDDTTKSAGFGPFPPNLDLIEFNDLRALEDYFQKYPECAAYMFEPVQGESGVIIPDDGYYVGVRKLCTQYNVLMIADEVQCGLGRTGYLSACDIEGVKPDILIVAKALGAGFYPLSAVLSNSDIMGVWELGTHGSTFSGNPLGSAVGIKAIEVLLEENLVENSKQKGEYVLEKLKEIQPSWVKDVRGRGMWFAIEPFEDSGITGVHLMNAMLDEGMLSYKAGKGVRMSPPLIMDKGNCDEMIEKTANALKRLG